MEKKNRNRGYKQLRVWEDAITLYVDTCRLFKPQAFEMKRVAGQAIASADSVHRNIAEGYCRRSIREYIQHLYIALSSLGERVCPATTPTAGQVNLPKTISKFSITKHSNSKTAFCA